MNLNLKENQKYDNTKNSKKQEGKRDYLQDLYGTPELSTTEFQVNKYYAFKTEFLTKEYTLNKVT